MLKRDCSIEPPWSEVPVNKDSDRTGDPNSSRERRGPSQLFLLRVWPELDGESQGSQDCHGKVQHAVTGQVRYFDSWLELAEILRAMISGKPDDRPGDATCGHEQKGPAQEPAPRARRRGSSSRDKHK